MTRLSPESMIRPSPSQQQRRHALRVECANKLQALIDSPLLFVTPEQLHTIYDAHCLLTHMIQRLDELERAAASLVKGVEELQDEWPSLDYLPSEGRHNDLIGFLFATLPLSQKALK